MKKRHNRRQTSCAKRQTEIKTQKCTKRDGAPTSTPPVPGEHHRVQMALPGPAETAAGWLRGATGAGGCDERTGNNDITGSVAPWQQKCDPCCYSQL